MEKSYKPTYGISMVLLFVGALDPILSFARTTDALISMGTDFAGSF